MKVFEAKCYLGLEVEQHGNGSIRIHQQAYARKILDRFGMTESKLISTPKILVILQMMDLMQLIHIGKPLAV